MNRTVIALVVVGIGVAGVVGADAATSRLALEEMTDAADAFLASLTVDQREQASFAFDSDERERHHFIPPEMWSRGGVSVGEMTAEQRTLAQGLLAAGLSSRGHTTVNEIMETEGILRELEGADRRFDRDGQAYWLAVFGDPSTDGSWGWRWEGHHLSLHFTVVEGELTVSTPTFLAASPARVPSGAREGLRALARQEDAGRALLASLDAAQLESTIFDDVAPRDIVTGADPVVDPLEPIGIRAADLSPQQRALLMEVIDAYVGVMADDIAALRMARIDEAGTDEIRFAWAGGTERGDVSYYRLQGSSFLIEYDNTADDPNHVHTTFRDFQGDLGRDLLREHLEADH
jgi:hypothetical protein